MSAGQMQRRTAPVMTMSHGKIAFFNARDISLDWRKKPSPSKK